MMIKHINVRPLIQALLITLTLSNDVFATSIVGVLEPQKFTTVSSQASSTVKKIWVTLGDKVEKGQLLAELEDEDYLLKTQVAESQFALSSAELRASERHYARVNNLYGKGLASVSELDDAKRAMEVNQAQLSLDKVNVDLAKANLRKTKILAPFNGIIGSRFIEVGQLLNNGSPTFDIVSTDHLLVVFYVLESDINTLRKDQLVTVTIPTKDNERYSAEIKRLAPSQLKDQFGYRVEAIIQNNHSTLRPGFTAKIELLTDTDQALSSQ